MYFLSSFSILLDQRALRLACTSVPSYFTTCETLRKEKRVLQLRVHEVHGS
jgi:hypothetical protein